MVVERRISSDLLQRILTVAWADADREVCGLLFGSDDVIDEMMPVSNVSLNPTDSFELDPALHFAALRHARSGGPAIVGHFHSHPDGLARPSVRDAAGANDLGQLWMIVSGAEAALWRVDAPGRFTPVRLVVA